MSAYALPELFHRGGSACGSITTFSSEPFSLAQEEKRDDEAHAIGIAVKEAKVDSALLLESLLGNTHNSAGATSKRKRRPRPGGETSSSKPSCQEALKFELSISLNGRSYTALRSLPSFEELRRDLQEETDEEIPELRFEESVQGYSFSFLQGIVQSYVPVVERWLREITRRVSPAASPSLRSFLWEPVSRPEYLHRDSSCSSQLDRIDETEMDETDHDDDSF